LRLGLDLGMTHIDTAEMYGAGRAEEVVGEAIGWRRDDGTHVDPWLRTHERIGAEIVKVASRSFTVAGTVAEWEEWTGMAFPESGTYVVPGALVPVEIDRERDEGLYVEPNVWMVHG
jgi:hypothetical protein